MCVSLKQQRVVERGAASTGNVVSENAGKGLEVEG